MKKSTCLILVLFFLSTYMPAQKGLYIPVNIQKSYDKGIRSKDGLPGKNYWQNHAEYKINVALDPSLGNIKGTEKVTYFNDSPDTLKQIVVALLMDMYKKSNLRDYYFSLDKLNDGVKIKRIKMGDMEIDVKGEKVKRRGTNMFITLEKPLAPKSSLKMEFDWEFLFPGNLTIRCGNYGDSTFFVAYFYPKIAVYDDIDGWDTQNYRILTEFYGDHSDYDVDISVPKNFVVWATGELQNAKEVLKSKYYKRWIKAKESENVFHIIKKEDRKKNKITQNLDQLHWKFKARSVPDFAFGTSDKHLWDGVKITVDKQTGRQTFVDAAYRPDSEDYYKVAKLAAKALTDYSTNIPGVPYPYPEMTIFNANAGMEFPMMCNNSSIKKWSGTFNLAYHEIAHTYFPFYTGINERKYAWMDEGWATLFPYFYMKKEFPENGYFNKLKNRYLEIAGTDREVPCITNSFHLKERVDYRHASYRKPFFAYYYLHEMLGDDVFKKALRGYIRRWSYKHPMPYDFFYSFNDLSEKDLNWYWEAWFMDRNHADLAIKEFNENGIVISNKGRLPLPVKLTLIYTNGTTKVIEKNISIWENNDNEILIKPENAEKIIKIILGDEYILDIDESNNVFERR